MTGFEIPSKSLSSLDPQCIHMYLSGSGWRRTFSMENYDVYRNASDEEVHVPRNNAFLDYPARMRELLTTLSEAEGRRIIDTSQTSAGPTPPDAVSSTVRSP